MKTPIKVRKEPNIIRFAPCDHEPPTPRPKHRTWAYLNDEGKRLWGDIFPDGGVPVRTLFPQRAGLEGAGEERVYMIEWSELTPAQQDAVLKKLSENFGAPKDAILKDILTIGLPLREKYTNGAGTTKSNYLL